MTTDTPARRLRCVATCLYGLEAVLAAEVRERLGVEGERHWCQVAFPYAGPVTALAGLRVAGNLLLEFDRFAIGPTLPDLGMLADRLRELPIDLWLERRRALGAMQDEPIHVEVSRRGEHNFTYAQVQELACDVLREAGRRATLDPGPLELRIEVDGEWCRLLGRLTEQSLEERAWRRYRMSSQTDGTMAAAMVRLAGLAPDDTLLDPFCGVGTVPIERALTAPAELVAAGDASPKRLQWAAANAEHAGVHLALAQWDAARLPFRAGSFTRVVTSPPQNDPSDGRPWRTGAFAELVAESLRVLKYGGRLVWLVQRKDLFERALKHLRAPGRHQRRFVTWKGRPWTIHIVEKPLSGTA